MIIVATVGIFLGISACGMFVAWVRKLIPRFNDLLELSKG